MSSTTAAKTCTILYDLSLHKAAVRFTYDDGPVKGLIASVNRKRQTVRLVGHTAAFESERIVGLKIDEDSHQSPRTIINCITPMIPPTAIRDLPALISRMSPIGQRADASCGNHA